MWKAMPLGGRIIKTGVAVALAVFLAQYLGLERYTLAAVVALLTVQRSFYNSLLQSAGKVGSVLLGSLLGAGVGLLLGPIALSFGLVTVLIIMICLKLNWQEHIAITTVTAVHLISFPGPAFPHYALEQVLLALLGAFCGLGINALFSPDHQSEVRNLLLYADQELGKELELLADEVLHPAHCNWEEVMSRYESLREKINEGLQISKLLQEEQRFQPGETEADRYRQAFRIFELQLDRIIEMHRLVRRMKLEVPQAAPLAKLVYVLRRVQRAALRGRKVPVALLDRAIENLEKSYEEMELPQRRAEFISRASLFHLFGELKAYYRKIKKVPPALADRKAAGTSSRMNASTAGGGL